MIEIKEVSSKRDIRSFVKFQFDLYKNSEYWVPPLKRDEIKSLLPEENLSMQYCDYKFWLALNNGKVVGRIGAIISHQSNKFRNENKARFSRLEFIDDHEVVKALLDTATEWAKEKGCDMIQGPLGFSNIDHQGMLIEGFEHLPSIASEYHMPYYKDHIKKLGFEKEMDWIEFRLTIPDEMPEKAVRLSEVLIKRSGISVRRFSSTKELLPYGKELFHLVNDSFSDLFSFVPFNDDTIDFYIKKFLPLLNAKFVKLLFDQENKLIGFIVPMPSLSVAMKKAKGSLFPFGWYHIMKAYKNVDTIDLMLTGVDSKHQGMGFVSILMLETHRTAREFNCRYAETTGMLENNKAIQNWKNFEHIQHKRKRCFAKKL